VRRGEVRWYRFSQPDKKRPVVILPRDSALEFRGEVTVAPITTTIRRIPTEGELTREDGMPRNCAVNLDHIQTVSRSEIGPLVMTLPPQKLLDMRKALMFAPGF